MVEKQQIGTILHCDAIRKDKIHKQNFPRFKTSEHAENSLLIA
jgi:hypothetical protein